MHYQTHVCKFLIVMYNLQLLFCDENAKKIQADRWILWKIKIICNIINHGFLNTFSIKVYVPHLFPFGENY